jgi:RNA polymerase sigma-70 factor (ECF subfamily)
VWDAEREHFEAHVLQVLTLRGDRIAEVTAFVEPALVAHFGLPATLR